MVGAGLKSGLTEWVRAVVTAGVTAMVKER